MKKILGIGNALVDELIRIDNDFILRELCLPKGGMTLIDGSAYERICQRLEDFTIERRTGGSAGNALLAVAGLGGSAFFIGKTGRDENGRFYACERQKQGVVSVELFDDTLPTGVAMTFISPDGQRTFATYLGAAASLTAADLKEEWFSLGDYLFVEGYLVQNHELIETAVDMARRAGLKVCLDLASWNIVAEDREFFQHLLTKTDMVFANEDEALAMTGEAPEIAISALSEHCETAIVKLGPGGATAMTCNEMAHTPAMPVAKVIDTTGAGDFFAGGFLYHYALGEELTTCLRGGARCAGAVIQVVGTKLSSEVWKTLRVSTESIALCTEP